MVKMLFMGHPAAREGREDPRWLAETEHDLQYIYMEVGRWRLKAHMREEGHNCQRGSHPARTAMPRSK
jgi:hypothetical protein